MKIDVSPEDAAHLHDLLDYLEEKDYFGAAHAVEKEAASRISKQMKNALIHRVKSQRPNSKS